MTEEDFKRLMAEYTVETRRHFDIAVEDIKASNAIVAEGVVATNERVERLEATVEELANEIRTEFADTRAMIKFSHSELDRRIRTLEDGFADLQARVERLEGGSTH